MDETLRGFVNACRAAGLKATHQRMEIYRELVRTGEHPDAETIYKRVKKRLPSLSLDTVYRTLRTLEDVGIVGRVGSIRDRARFDANVAPHHHFVCTRCGGVSDFNSDALDDFDPPRPVKKMGRVESVYVELRGVCRRCQGRG